MTGPPPLHGLDRLIGSFSHHGRVPVLVVEDTEAALGARVDAEVRDRFFRASFRLLVRELDTPALLALQDHFSEFDASSICARTFSRSPSRPSASALPRRSARSSPGDSPFTTSLPG